MSLERRLQEKQMGDTPTAKRFYNILVQCGFTPTEKPIRIKNPVADKNGHIKKTVHVPDFYVEDDRVGKMYFEVTQGSGNTQSKEAQRRVVDAANITNYQIIDGDTLRLLESVPDDYKPLVVTDLLFQKAKRT